MFARLMLAVLLLAFVAETQAAPRFKAVAFDYFVLFNPNSVVPEVEKAFPGRGAEFTKTWRAKQFEYGFLRSITGRHEDFFKVTEDALVYTAAAMELPLSPDMRDQLLGAYLTLQPWPDSIAALRKLKAAGVRLITIANFSDRMLRANAENAGIAELFDELLSTGANGTYKPDPRAYALGMQRLGLNKEEIAFAAFGRIWREEFRVSDLLGEQIRPSARTTRSRAGRHLERHRGPAGFRPGRGRPRGVIAGR